MPGEHGSGGRVIGCACGQAKLRWVAIDPETGDCLLPKEDGSCTRFASSGRAMRAAIAAGHESPGVARL